MTNRVHQFVVFALEEQRYALDLFSVRRVVQAVDITRLPKAPDIVLGVINVAGKILPVVNIRRRFALREREIRLSDQIIIANAARRPVALLVDSVAGLMERPKKEIFHPTQILPSMEYVAGVIKLEDGLVLIHDLDKFLSLDEENQLKEALSTDDRS